MKYRLLLIRGQSRMLDQVCNSMAIQQTRKREIEALSGARSELDLKEKTIMARAEEEIIGVESGTLNVVAAW